MKASNDTIGNRSCNLPLAAQCLNQLRHHVPISFVWLGKLLSTGDGDAYNEINNLIPPGI